jgi:signal transduction histidine kinase
MDWAVLGYVLAGTIAWWRRPESRFGPLMIAVGFAFALLSLTWSNAPVPFSIGIAVDLLPAALYLHVFLAFPSGRVVRPFERALVAAAYFTAVGVQFVGLALGGFGPDNAFAILSEPDAAATLLKVQLVALSAFALTGIVAVWRRPARRPLRGSVALLVDAFALGLVMIAFLYLSAAFGGLVTGQLAFETIRRTTFFVIGLAPLAFLFGLLHARLARSAVAELLVELRRKPDARGVRDALAHALRDPSLTLAYWLPQFEGWADVDGRPVALAELEAGRASTVLESDGRYVAALIHDPSLENEPELLDAVAAAAAIALENTRLNVELRARLDELQGSRARIVEAGDAERRRLERNLHDGAQQRLVAVALQLRLLQNRIRGDPEEAELLATAASAELANSLNELRELARGLHPAVLEHGLNAALMALATRSPVPTTITYEAPERLPEPVELAAYFVASEALTNVAKYANATAATVRVSGDAQTLAIEIADDGVGGADDGLGSGLRGLADRVEALDGMLRVVSPAGAGTTVTAELPCAS